MYIHIRVHNIYVPNTYVIIKYIIVNKVATRKSYYTRIITSNKNAHSVYILQGNYLIAFFWFALTSRLG